MLKLATPFLSVGMVLLATASLSALTATSFTPDRGFRGITSVCVRVETLDLDFPTDTLEEELAKRLTTAGVPTVAPDDCFKSVDQAAVVVWLKGSPSSSGRLYAYEVDISLQQGVALLRDPSYHVDNATTWENWKIGLCQSAALNTELRARAIELIDMFADIYKGEHLRPHKK